MPILIKFVTTNFRGNNIFIDNININNENETSLTDLIHTNPKIYPNPSNNKIIIQLNNNVFDAFTLTNTIGQIIFQQKINNLEFEIDLTSIPQGIYFLNLLSKGSFKTKQIIKF